MNIPPAFKTVFTRDAGTTYHAKSSGPKPYRVTCTGGEEAAALSLVRKWVGSGFDVEPDPDNGQVTKGGTWTAWKVVRS